MDQTRNCIFQCLGGLLRYPDDAFPERLEHYRTVLAKAHPQIDSNGLRTLSTFPLETLEEVFTHTFDLMPSCILYVGIHLFGEGNFKRGEFMARLRQQFEELKFQESAELPDHLRVLLCFLPHLDIASQKELVGLCLLSPLQKIIASLDENNPYRAVLQITRDLLQAEFPDVQAAPLPVEQTNPRLQTACASPAASGLCPAEFTIRPSELNSAAEVQANTTEEIKPPSVLAPHD